LGLLEKNQDKKGGLAPPKKGMGKEIMEKKNF
jgi:hypothetical protein